MREGTSAPLHAIDPLRDPRWEAFVERHPRASVFHTVPWLDALRRTYGYEPIAYTTSPPDMDLESGLVFCRVQSWLTGQRLVSLPFSDYCEPLVDSAEELERMLGHLEACRRSDKWKYIEIRPASGDLPCGSAEEGFRPARQYYLHTIDLGCPEKELFRRFHKSSIQDRIRRAEKLGLTYECGRSNTLLRKFCLLMQLTRRRHHLPPQPEEWFRNLVEGLGDALEIHVASYKNKMVAGIVTLRFRNMMLYKYGGSDEKYHRLGSVPFLLWRAIQKGKSSGVRTFDLGRTDCFNQGLTDFKERWNSTQALLTYWQYPAPARGLCLDDGLALKLGKYFFGLLPDSMLRVAGNLLYRHIG